MILCRTLIMVRQLKLYLLTIFFFSAVSCSIAGSWAFERIDDYLASSFNEYADFSVEQQSQIAKFSKDYQSWLAKSELPKVKALLLQLKKINHENSEELTLQLYDYARDLYTKTGHFFEIPFVKFSKTLSKKQILEIEKYLVSTQNDWDSEIAGGQKEYSDVLLERYIAGFKRIKMKLTDSQIKTVVAHASAMDDLRLQWSLHRKEWTAQLLVLLYERSDPLYEMALISHLKQISSIGDSKFQSKLKKNREITIDIISNIFEEASESQLDRFRERLDVFIASIDRILATR